MQQNLSADIFGRISVFENNKLQISDNSEKASYVGNRPTEFHVSTPVDPAVCARAKLVFGFIANFMLPYDFFSNALIDTRGGSIYANFEFLIYFAIFLPQWLL